MMHVADIPFLLTHRVVARVARIYEHETGIDRHEFEGEAYLKIVDKLHRYRTSWDWEAWCWYTAKSAATALIRRESYRRVMPLPPGLEFQEYDPSDWVIEQLRTLSDQEAEAVVWTLGLDGPGPRGCGEVGHALGTTTATIKLRKSRALRKLRDRLCSDYRPAFGRREGAAAPG